MREIENVIWYEMTINRLTMKGVAKKYHLTNERVRQIYAKCIREFKKGLKN